MQVIIRDSNDGTEYANWQSGEFSGLSFGAERIGGMISASFVVPADYKLPFAWAKQANRVSIYNGPKRVWYGYVHDLERYWSDGASGIKVDCAGLVARLAKLVLSTNLSNEKASTYITDHILTAITGTIETGSVDTSDYTIPGVREYKPVKTVREVLDDLHSFNQNTHDWYVKDDLFYWTPKETSVSYVTTTKDSVGSCRQGLSDFANWVWYSYTDATGLITSTYVQDTDSELPKMEVPESYSGNMTAAQALQIATESLNNRILLGTTAGITVSRCWNTRGQEVHPSEIEPGKIIRVEGLIPAAASVGEAFTDNDIDTFPIAAVTYNDDSQTAEINPGRIGATLPVVLTRLAK